jgi:hypothetical protein
MAKTLWQIDAMFHLLNFRKNISLAVKCRQISTARSVLLTIKLERSGRKTKQKVVSPVDASIVSVFYWQPGASNA